MSKTGADADLTIIVVPESGGASRTYRLTRRRQRVLITGVIAVTAVLTLMAGSWWYLALQAAKIPDMKQRLARAAEDSVRIEALSAQLSGIAGQYEQLRGLFGPAPTQGAPDVWLPPPSGSRRAGAPVSRTVGPTLPDAWPLAERGFVTQGLLDGDAGEHAGLDIAVPADSYVRAAGGGTVVDVGEDDVYGRFVVLDHGDGYTSLYAHASLTLVTRGQAVRRGEVIALTGSTGRSTAPHLHFELSHDGVVVDPLTLVSQP